MKKLILLLVFIALVAPHQSFAENSVQTTSPQDKDDFNTTRPANAEQDKNKFEQKQTEFKSKIGEIETNFKEHKASLEADMKAKFQLQRDAFKEKLKLITDEKKKTLAERVEANLSKINQNRTNEMSKKLDRLEKILTELKTKTSSASAAGKNVSTVTAAITAAETTIANAKTAIAKQAGKDYTPTITDQTTLRQNFSAMVKQLQTDLSATNKTLADSKKAVLAVAKALRALINPTETPTP